MPPRKKPKKVPYKGSKKEQTLAKKEAMGMKKMMQMRGKM